jgi:DNA-binding CsgD family transcriptional regulator
MRHWPAGIPPDLADLMEHACTDAELDALEWKARGYGTRRIAERLGISHTAARDRLARASRKIRAAKEATPSPR